MTRPIQPRRRDETIDYIWSMLGELRSLAEAERCDMLSYLIEMAEIEAGDVARGDRPVRVRAAGPGGAGRRASD